jgi:hypothetical protein
VKRRRKAMNRTMSKVALGSAIRFIERKRGLGKKLAERSLIKQVIEEATDYICRVRKLGEGSSPTHATLSQGSKSFTLIVSGRCKNGVVMVADRRSMRGTEYKEEKKIHEFYGVVTAFAGLVGLKDKFLEMVEQVLQATRVLDLSEAIIGVEDTMALISERYENRLRGEARIVALLAGLENR